MNVRVSTVRLAEQERNKKTVVILNGKETAAEIKAELEKCNPGSPDVTKKEEIKLIKTIDPLRKANVKVVMGEGKLTC